MYTEGMFALGDVFRQHSYPCPRGRRERLAGLPYMIERTVSIEKLQKEENV